MNYHPENMNLGVITRQMILDIIEMNEFSRRLTVDIKKFKDSEYELQKFIMMGIN